METPDRISPETSVQFVKGIGPRRAELLRQAGVESIEDLITYYPRRYLDRSHISKISSLQPGQDVTVVGKVLHTEIRRSRRSRFIVHI